MALVASLTITSGTLALLVSESALADDNLQASQAGATLTAQDAHDIARDTYVYAFPMVLAEVTRRVMTNVEAPVSVGLGHAPMNQFGHMLTFPTENTTDVARPNADTLYSSLWFDVSHEPLVITVPDSGGRFYLLQITDMWTDTFASPGKRTTGTQAQTFVIANDGWKGHLPAGATLIRSPTPIGWVLGRTQTNGVVDFDAVHVFQQGIKAVPLSHYGKAYAAPWGTVDPKQDMSSPLMQVRKMDAPTYFGLFAELMKNNPPHLTDFSMLQRMKRIGIEPGKSFSFEHASPAVQQALTEATGDGGKLLMTALTRMSTSSNGWHKVNYGIGSYGSDYLHRAVLALAGTVANTVDDAIYPFAVTDSEGKPFRSDQRYLLHFNKDQLPPARAFWSLTMYDQHQLFAANPIHRYAIGDRDKLSYNADGSLDIYIQRESPGKDEESNWLPTPAEGNFTMNLRLYWPEIAALSGVWGAPGVLRVP